MADRTVAYTIAKKGAVGFDMPLFARIVNATLNDPRGWALGGAVRFKEASSGSFRVTLAAPGVVGSFGACSSFYSCRAGSYVLINSERWAQATPTFPGRALLHSYRQLAVNHEVGHALGFGHRSCGKPGLRAPVMQQQSKGLGGCKGNPWPVPSERAALGRRLGVAVRRTSPSLVLGKQIRWIELGRPRRDVLAHLGDPTSRRRRAARLTESYRHLRLRFVYVDDRVQGITTRSAEDVSSRGIGPGVPLRRLRARLRGERCLPEGSAVKRCVWGRADRRGDRPTTFVIRAGRVAAIRIERLLATVSPPEPAPAPTPPPAPTPQPAPSPQPGFPSFAPGG